MIAPRALAAVRRLRKDRRGSTVVEFAIVAPVICTLLLAAFDVAHTLYTQSVMQGIVQKTARDATLEGSDTADAQAALDAKVITQLKSMAANADITIKRRFYRTFTNVAQQRAESFTDTNSNQKCDAGEPFQDDNLNGVWDSDGGNAGQGGAKDATLYTVRMTYPRMLPIWRVIGGSNTTELIATTVLKNQPFGDQGQYGSPVVRNCP